jgi:sulfur-oxidizing protein SoxY
MNLINRPRRALLKSIGCCLSFPLISGKLLANWPKEAFMSTNIDKAIGELYGHLPQPSGRVELKVPDIAENGAVVPISVSTDIENVESISIYVAGNPNPLAATFELSPYIVAVVSTRIKMGKTSNVVAAVYSGGTVYTATQEVKVTIGGCGG